jgi:hypothetical protein
VISFFTVPKPFVGQIGIIQFNALYSWLGSVPNAEVLLFGDEHGIREAAREVGARHEPMLLRTERGSPRVDHLFARGEALAMHSRLCFVNADIVLPPVLDRVLEAVDRRFGSSILVGQCRNMDVEEHLVWNADFEAKAAASPLRGPGGIDYLVFPRGAFPEIPPFALGRAHFDNWLLWAGRKRGLPVVDLTAAVTAVHQTHDYAHIEGGRAEAYEGPEAQLNLALAGGRIHLFNIDDATHRMTPHGFRRNSLAPLRTFPATRWLALEVGRAKRALKARLTA